MPLSLLFRGTRRQAALLVPAATWVTVALATVPIGAEGTAGAAVPETVKRLAAARVDSARWCADVRLLSGADTLPGVQPATSIASRFFRSVGIGLTTEWICSELATCGYTTRRDTFLAWSGGETTVCWNIVAEVQGAVRARQVVVLGAHYDSRAGNADPRYSAPGAEDNATGTALVLEAARALAGLHCDRTVRFVLFSAEEQGLFGSRDFATRAIAAGDTIAAAIIADMVGWHAGTPGLILDARREHAWLAEIAAEAVRNYTTVADSVQLSDSGLVPSDHYSFAAVGAPAVLLVDRDWRQYPDYHTTRDVWSSIQATTQQGAAATRAAVATVADVAGLRRAGLPVIVRDFQARRRDTTVELTWETVSLPPDAGVAVMRADDGPWQLLTPVPLTPRPGPTLWRDTAPPFTGQAGLYRLDLVQPGGDEPTPLAGPIAAAAPAPAGEPAARLALATRRLVETGETALVATAGRGLAATLHLYDLGGRVVRDLWRGWLPEAGVTVTWDGRDDRGRVVAAGLYLARLEADGAQAVAKVTRVR